MQSPKVLTTFKHADRMPFMSSERLPSEYLDITAEQITEHLAQKTCFLDDVPQTFQNLRLVDTMKQSERLKNSTPCQRLHFFCTERDPETLTGSVQFANGNANVHVTGPFWTIRHALFANEESNYVKVKL